MQSSPPRDAPGPYEPLLSPGFTAHAGEERLVRRSPVQLATPLDSLLTTDVRFYRSLNNTVFSFAPQEFGSEGSGATRSRRGSAGRSPQFDCGDDGAEDDVKKPPGFGRLLVRKRQGIVYFSRHALKITLSGARVFRSSDTRHIDPWTPLACFECT